LRAGGEFSAIARYERRAIARRAFVRSLPVLMGYLTMGFAAGVLMAAKGPSSLAPLWAGVCAFTTFSSQARSMSRHNWIYATHNSGLNQ
jgi:fluoride ion exporter CrcB/FEX